MKSTAQIRRENFEILIREYGSNKKLSEATGKSEAQLSQWKTGSRNIERETCEILENKLGLHVGWFDVDHFFVPDDIRYKDTNEIGDYRRIPLYKRPAWDAVHDKGRPIKWIGCVSEGYSKETYALECLNDSLMDINNKVMIRKSDIVIIDPERKPHDGSYVLATSSKYKLVALKIYKVQDSKKFLYTPNPDWQEKWIRIDDTIQLHGTVIEVIKIVEK